MINKYQDKFFKEWFWSGFGTLAFLCIMLILSGLCMFAGLSVNIAIPILSILISCIIVYSKSGYRSLLLTLLTIIWSIAFSALTFDTASDSIGYHETTIRLLQKGWNYIYQDPDTSILWVPHYARAQEILSACIISLTGVIEIGKSVNLIYALTCFFLTCGLLCRLCKKINYRKIIVLALILNLNPVTLVQIFTFYNDLFLYPGILVMTLSFICLYQKDNTKQINILWILNGMISIILINTKFTHFFYCSLIWLIFYALLLCNSKYVQFKKALFVGLVSLFIGIIIVGYNPYITNLVYYGDPFYPLMSGNVDIMSGNTPTIYHDDNRFVNFFKAQLSNYEESWAILKHPKTISNYFQTTLDSRVLGFGPFFILLLLLSVIIMILNKPSIKLWIVYIGVILITFMFSQSWWARYAPMIWATLGISVFASYKYCHGVILRRILVSLVLLNSCIVFVRGNAQSVIGAIQWNNFKQMAKGSQVKIYFNEKETIKWHIDTSKIDYIEIPEDSIDFKRVYTIIGNPDNDEFPVYEISNDKYDDIGVVRKAILNYSRKDFK